jgi:6-pyruvoyltetrahydropterin/6-carboxytetrahydropterin synthase
MFTIAKRFSFSASHRLQHLPEDHPCHRLHGHNYEIEVILRGEKLDPFGMLYDYRRLDDFKRWVDDHLDHRDLNSFFLPEISVTAEFLARHLFSIARMMLGDQGDLLWAIRVSETPKTWAEYRRDS